MAQYIHPDVEEICDNPSSEGSVNLILVPYEGQEEALQNRIQDLFENQENNQIDRDVRFGMLVVTVDEKMVKRICDIPALKSVTLDEGMEVLDAKPGLGDRENNINQMC